MFVIGPRFEAETPEYEIKDFVLCFKNSKLRTLHLCTLCFTVFLIVSTSILYKTLYARLQTY
jgi:hypothetical protein